MHSTVNPTSESNGPTESRAKASRCPPSTWRVVGGVAAQHDGHATPVDRGGLEADESGLVAGDVHGHHQVSGP